MTICVALYVTFGLSSAARAFEQVSLQLKWRHQFQFAGYYAAIEKGFYRENGLDVEIREGGPDVDAAISVTNGTADFGVCTTSVLLNETTRSNNVILGVIFQHSAAIILAPYRSGIRAVSELKGRRLLDVPGSDDIAAMLRKEGVDYGALPRPVYGGDVRDLLAGKGDALVAYTTNEPYALDKLGVPYVMFSPRAFGFDFYGDSLCTSKLQLKQHPDRVRAFRSASLKGWQYALAHKEEMVDLIMERYSGQKGREALMFEAAQTELLVQPHLIPVGEQTVDRWKSIAATYVGLGMLKTADPPEGMIYLPDEEGPLARTTAWVFAAAVLALAIVLAGGWLLYGRYSRRLQPPRLSAVMSASFVFLSIPVLIFILLYNYRQNSAAMNARLDKEILKMKQASIEAAESLINPVASTLKLLAAMAAEDPSLFRKEESRELLYQALTSARQIDAAYVSFEDGYHRVVTRVDDDRRHSDSKIPALANWHSSYIDGFAGATRRARHRTFFDVWPNEVGRYDVETTIDIRTLAGYQAAKEARGPIVEEPSINPDTGYPIISMRFPIIRNETFVGCASANITLDVLSRFLTSHRASAHSTTIIANPANATIIAYPDPQKSVRKAGSRTEFARLDDIADGNVREAYRLQSSTNRDDFVFLSPVSGEEISASFTRFPASFGRPWEVVILTPTGDFIGDLSRTNRQMIGLIAVLTAIELTLIYLFSRRLSRPIEIVSRELRSVEDFSFEPGSRRSSRIREIRDLQTAASLFQTSLRSFSSFVPLDIVRELVRTGTPLSLGVEARFMTVMFSDLQDFSSLAEHIPPRDLLDQLSAYFEAVSHAVTAEHGTVDKFIGDGVMAFWGAPARRADHVQRACSGALRSARRMSRINHGWAAQGRPRMRVRIGVHCADVLVGNVGSSDRLSYTVIGDGVNVAARLQAINRTFGTTICISDSVYEAARTHIVARPLRRVQVKGRNLEFMVYELLGLKNSDDPELAPPEKAALLCEMTSQASASFERGEFELAARRYEAILRLVANDPVALSMRRACQAGERTITAAEPSGAHAR